MIDNKRYQKIGDYIFWKYANDVRPYIFEFLKKEFPGTLIIHEFDQVDVFVLEANLPVEIQSTSFRNNGYPYISKLEDDIRRQIDANIRISGKCWLFLDDAFLRYLQNDLGHNACINLDWLYQYMKEGNVKIFTITYGGIIKDMTDNDFNFLFKDEDIGILEMNKANIALNVLKGHGFTTEEIDDLYNKYKNRDGLVDTDRSYCRNDFMTWLSREGRSNRELEYRYVICAKSTLSIINKILDCTVEKGCTNYATYVTQLGLFDRDKNNSVGFVDKYNIAQYFPGYLRKKELWNSLRTHRISTKTFYAIIRGEIDYLWYKKQKNISSSWGIEEEDMNKN